MARHNLGTVISFEVIRTLKRKQFWAGTLLVPLAIGAVIGLNVVSNSTTTKKVDSQKNSKFSFVYTDNSGFIDPAIAKEFGGSSASDSGKALADVKAGKLSALFIYPKNPAAEKIDVYGKDQGIFDNGKYSAVATELLTLSAQSKVQDKSLLAIYSNRLNVDSITYKDGKVSGSIGDVIPPLLFLVIFYIVILMLGNQMLTSTQEEKENRVTEIILTTLNPTTLVLGKVFSLFIIGITQIFIFTLPVITSYVFFRSNLHLPNFDLSSLHFALRPMTIGLLLLLSGFSLFTGTLVAVGAIMPTAKEAGQAYGAVVTLLFIPFWIIALVASDPHAWLVQVFTYFPYSAPVTAMVRNGLGSLSTGEAAIVVSELFILGFFVLRLAIRLFRYGSMEYTKKVSLKVLFARNGRK